MITAPTQFSGLQVWLDASDTTRLFQLSGGTTAVAANLDPVGYWGDKSGNNRHFTNIGGSATTRPTWVSSLSTVRFDGSNDYLSSFFNITYTAQTVFVVVSQRVGVAAARIYTQVSSGGGGDAGATDQYIPCMVSSSANQLASWNKGSYRSTVTTRSLSTFDLFTSWFSSVSTVNFVNAAAGAYYGSTLNYNVALSRLGAAGTTVSSYFNGDISEVIVYNRALTNNERADVEYYLTRKWNFLNSIPRQVYGIKNGLWSLTDTWSVSAEPSPWNFPLSADNAYTNTFTITADSSTKVDTIRNSLLAPNIAAGGSFVLANGVSLSANVLGGVAPYTLTLLPAASSTLVGGVTGIAIVNTAAISGFNSNTFLEVFGDVYSGNQGTAYGISNSSSSHFKVNGNLYTRNAGNAPGDDAVINSGAGSITVVGNLIPAANTNSSSGGASLRNTSTGSVYLYGNSYGVGNYGRGILNAFTGYVFVSGNVYGSSTGIGEGVKNLNASGKVDVYGSIIATNFGPAIESSSTTTSPLSVYGNIINAPNGRQAIYAPRYQVFPTGSAQYTRQASNGYDSYVDYWTSNSTFSYPASSDVALGTTYSNSTLSGSMAVPSPSSVALGALVGTTTGTASITFDGVLNQPIANLTTPNSIGARLKNITTSQALSAIVDSLEF